MRPVCSSKCHIFQILQPFWKSGYWWSYCFLQGKGDFQTVHTKEWLWTGRSGDRIPVGCDFLPFQTSPGAHPASCTMGTGSFPGVKYSRGVLLTTHPLLVPWSWKNRAIPLPTLWATTGPVMGTLCNGNPLCLPCTYQRNTSVLASKFSNFATRLDTLMTWKYTWGRTESAQHSMWQQAMWQWLNRRGR